MFLDMVGGVEKGTSVDPTRNIRAPYRIILLSLYIYILNNLANA